MAKLKIQNVGPIREGYTENEGYLEFSDIVLLIGKQGSGKSTVAKIYSTFCWIEKALLTWRIKEKKTTEQKGWFKKLLEYHNIKKYLNSKSYIHYKGKYYEFQYKDTEFTCRKTGEVFSRSYLKIQYVPAERNLLSVVKKLSAIKGLPLNLKDFHFDFAQAKERLHEDGRLKFLDIELQYNENNDEVMLADKKNYTISLNIASSGYQSVVPLLLVTHNISSEKEISMSLEQVENFSEKVLTNKELRDKFAETIQLPYQSADLLEGNDLASINRLLEKRLFQQKRNIFIIEELEQNLYPNSQRTVLFELLKYYNQSQSQIILTTHSPYLIGYLSLAAKAGELYQSEHTEIFESIAKIVPEQSHLKLNDLRIYQLNNNSGGIDLLPLNNGIPPRENLLNFEMAQTNDDFLRLLELENDAD